jgi:hypothetical protein
MKQDSCVSARLMLATLVVVVLGAATLLVQATMADELYGRIRGVVLDPSGAAVPEVRLALTSVGTGIKQEDVSGPDGGYTFINLKPGSYSLSATKAGFRTFTVTGIKVEPNEIFVQNIPLELGTTSETVEVSATQTQVEQTSMELTNSITSKTITDLPLNGRNYIFLQQTLPGVVVPDTRFNTNFSTNGSQAQQNSYLVNGNDSNDLPLNSPLAPPNPDSIEEVKMVTNTINPEYGRNSGAILNAVTKSGTNSFHGTGFEFFRDTSLNTHDFFHKTATIFHQNQFGGTFGGPIWKNKSFAFFAYQGTRARQPGANSNGTTNVLTQDQLNGAFDPANMSATKTNPFPIEGSNGTLYPAGTPWATIFPTGVVPTSDFNPLAVSLVQKFVPLPNCGSGCNIYSFNPVTKLTADQYLGRFDQNFGSRDSLWFYGYANNQSTLNDIPFSGSSLPGFGDQSVPFTKQFTAAYQHTFSSDMLNELRAGYTRLNFNTGTPQVIVQPKDVGFPTIFPQIPQGASYPRMTVDGYFSLGGTSNGPQPRIDQTYQLTDNFSVIKGKHTLKFGYDGRKFQVWNPFGARNNGLFSFTTAGNYSTGDAGLNFLLGIPTSYNQGSGQIILAEAWEHYMYAQDQWHVRPDLTLTFGAGYQIDTPVAEYQNGGLSRACFIPGQQSKIFPVGTAPNGNPGGAPVGYNFPGDPGCDKYGGASTKYNHIGPRVGFAYTPEGRWTGGKGKTSIRGGFGIYFNRGEEELNLQDLGSPPIGQTSNGIGDEGFTPSFPDPWTDITGQHTLTNKFPYQAPTPGAVIDFSVYYPMAINTVDKSLTTPYAMNYMLTVERELPSAVILRVGYVGSQGRKLPQAYSFNPMTPVGVQTCLTIPACATNGDQAPKKFPDLFLYPADIWGNSGMIHTLGTSNYNSLQISANKRLTHGLQFDASYTYAHSLDTGSSFEDVAFLTTGSFDPYGNRQRDHGSSAFDARNRFTFVFSYEFPHAHVVQPLLNGWRITGNTVLQSGFPVNLQDSNEFSLVCSPSYSFYACPDRPDIVSGVHYMDPRASSNHQWFSTSSFTDNAVGTLGTAGRGVVRGPGYWGTNFSVQKDTSIMEGKTIQLRLEFYNIFNHANFANPVGDFAAKNFGQITSLRPFVNSGPSPEGSRLIQLGAKFIF